MDKFAVPGYSAYKRFRGNAWCVVLFWLHAVTDRLASRLFWLWRDEYAKQYNDAKKNGRA